MAADFAGALLTGFFVALVGVLAAAFLVFAAGFTGALRLVLGAALGAAVFGAPLPLVADDFDLDDAADCLVLDFFDVVFVAMVDKFLL